jgi:hypothetical protein
LAAVSLFGALPIPECFWQSLFCVLGKLCDLEHAYITTAKIFSVDKIESVVRLGVGYCFFGLNRV